MEIPPWWVNTKISVIVTILYVVVLASPTKSKVPIAHINQGERKLQVKLVERTILTSKHTNLICKRTHTNNCSTSDLRTIPLISPQILKHEGPIHEFTVISIRKLVRSLIEQRIVAFSYEMHVVVDDFSIGTVLRYFFPFEDYRCWCYVNDTEISRWTERNVFSWKKIRSFFIKATWGGTEPSC